jgi:serine phosphatase RsbU (regulator of sigma subunit)
VKKIVSILFSFLPLSFMLLIPYWIDAKNYIEEEMEEEEKNFIRVAMLEDKAYWVVNNALYCAEVVDGEIIKENSEQVNAFDLNFKEVNDMMNILDSIQDWKDE